MRADDVEWILELVRRVGDQVSVLAFTSLQLLDRAPAFQRCFDPKQEPVRVVRLVVESLDAQLVQETMCRTTAAVGGMKDDLQPRIPLANLPNQIRPGHLRHRIIDEGNLNRLFPQHGQRLVPIARRHDSVSLTLEEASDGDQRILLVVYDEDGSTRWRGM